MSRLSNLTTLKIGIFKSWNTYWFDKQYYAVLLFNDLRIRDYLSGIFYKLKVVSDYFYLYRFLNKNDIITTNLIFFSNIRFKSLTLRNIYSLGVNYVFFYQKRYWKYFIYYTKLLRKFYNHAPIKYQNVSIGTSCMDYLTTYILSTTLSARTTPYYTFSKNYTNPLSSDITGFGSEKVSYIGSTIGTAYLLSNNINFTNPTIANYFTLTKWIISNNNTILFKNNLSYFWYCKTLMSKYQLILINILKYMMYFVYTLSSTVYLVPGMTKILSIYMPLAMLLAMPVLEKGVYMQDYFYLNLKEQENLMIYTDRRYITKSLFNALRANIEKTISLFNQNRVYFNFSIFFKKNPFIVSAKLVTETLVYLLQSGKKVVPSFFFIRNWQTSLYKGKRSLEHTYFQYAAKRTNLNYLFYYASKRFPLIGIRIECSGTYKKGRMARIYFYSSWVKDDVLTGRMPNSTMIADIDYYQYFAITKSSSIGIKTWIFLETHLYNNNNKYISIVY